METITAQVHRDLYAQQEVVGMKLCGFLLVILVLVLLMKWGMKDNKQ